MINSINHERFVVEVEFDVGNKSYKVIRGAKPNKFELYLNKTLVKSRCNHERLSRPFRKEYTQDESSFLYSSGNSRSANFTPLCNFVLERDVNLVEDLLDISIFRL